MQIFEQIFVSGGSGSIDTNISIDELIGRFLRSQLNARGSILHSFKIVKYVNIAAIVIIVAATLIGDVVVVVAAVDGGCMLLLLHHVCYFLPDGLLLQDHLFLFY